MVTLSLSPLHVLSVRVGQKSHYNDPEEYSEPSFGI